MSIFTKIGNLFKGKSGGTAIGNLLRKATGQPPKGTTANANPLLTPEASMNPLAPIVTNTTAPTSGGFFGNLFSGITGILTSAKNAIDNGITINTKADNKSMIYIFLGLGSLIFLVWYLSKKKKGGKR